MANNPIFSYTRRDYERSRKEGLAKIPLISKGQWTDLNATDPGIIILDYVHALVDMMNYYLDHQALESFMSTAKERVNIFRLAKQLSYEIRSAKGATCEVEFAVSQYYGSDVLIPKYTRLSSTTGIPYITSKDTVLKVGENIVNVPCEQGVVTTITYQGTGQSRFSDVVGATNQSIKLLDNNIDIDSITITDESGTWERVDYIAFSTELDRVYEVELNYDNSITIKFGDGLRGVVPSTLMTVSYIMTLAEEGRVSKNSITILEDEITHKEYDSESNEMITSVVYFEVNNKKASNGGSAPPTSQDIKDLAPGVIKSQDRAVTLSDYEYLAKSIDGVKDARARDINTDPDFCLYHEVKLLIIPDDPQGDTYALVDRVYNYISRRMIPPTYLQVMTPSPIPVDVHITIRLLKGADEEKVRYDINTAIKSYFEESVSVPGESFYATDLASSISNIEGVRNIVEITPSTYSTNNLSIIVLGDISINIQ